MYIKRNNCQLRIFNDMSILSSILVNIIIEKNSLESLELSLKLYILSLKLII